MKFYEKEQPDIDEVTMCTVLSYNDGVGFDIHLDEYDMNGFLANKELSTKNRIRKSIASFLKVGTQLPLQIVTIEHDRAIVSKKTVNNDNIKECKQRFGLNQKIFALARRLAFTVISAQSKADGKEPCDPDLGTVAGVEKKWLEQFRPLLSTEEELEDHLYYVLSDRDKISGLNMKPEQIAIIEHHHAKLFGIKPITITSEFTIQVFDIEGMKKVQDVLLSILGTYRKPDADKDGTDSWTDEELYAREDVANVNIIPSAIPTFQLQVTAYQRQHAKTVNAEIKVMLERAHFDVLQFK
jgi:translation initiation factor 2 alpha subunit (eIF-2alpha)